MPERKLFIDPRIIYKRKFLVKEDCFCEHYLHEINNYPRDGLKEKKLLKGDMVEFVKEWWNYYGKFIRVEKDGIEYDIIPEKLQEI